MSQPARGCPDGVLNKSVVAVLLDAQPNVVRLSCAAVPCFSQMQFYYDGRRQLQPLVRLRTDNRSSDPSCDRNDRRTQGARACTAAVTPTGSTLGFVGGQPPPAAYGTFIRE